MSGSFARRDSVLFTKPHPRSVGGPTYFGFFLTSITEGAAQTVCPPTKRSEKVKRDKLAAAAVTPAFVSNDIVKLEVLSEWIRSILVQLCMESKLLM